MCVTEEKHKIAESCSIHVLILSFRSSITMDIRLPPILVIRLPPILVIRLPPSSPLLKTPGQGKKGVMLFWKDSKGAQGGSHKNIFLLLRKVNCIAPPLKHFFAPQKCEPPCAPFKSFQNSSTPSRPIPAYRACLKKKIFCPSEKWTALRPF